MSVILFLPKYRAWISLRSLSGARSLISLSSRSSSARLLHLSRPCKLAIFFPLPLMTEIFTTSASTSGSGLFRFSKTFWRTTASRFLSGNRSSARLPGTNQSPTAAPNTPIEDNFIRTPSQKAGRDVGWEPAHDSLHRILAERRRFQHPEPAGERPIPERSPLI